MDWERLFIGRLFVAIPQVAWSDELIRYALRRGYLQQSELDELNYWKGQYSRVSRIAGRLSSKSFTQQLLILAPELVSLRTVDLLRHIGLVNDADGHRLRLLVRALNSQGLVPGLPPTNGTIRTRLQALLQIGYSQETIDLLRLEPIPGIGRRLSVEEAEFLRGTLIGAQQLAAAKRAAGAGEGLVDSLFLFASELLDERTIRALVLTGSMSAERARLINAAIKLGNTAWRTYTRLYSAASFEQRALILSTGILSQEMVTFLRTAGIIDAKVARSLSVAVRLANSIARAQLDAATQINRAYRVNPGESPIATFARTSRTSERELIGLLEEAAKETRDAISRLAPASKIGGKTRAAQERILLNGIYGQVRDLWEGVGYLTIIGERSAARAGVDAMDFLLRDVMGHSGAEADAMRRYLREAGRAGVDNMISREENLHGLSARVYKNIAFANQLISRRIKINLIRGVGAKEFADDIAKLIRPNVRGGVSYAAMRLARTELNNAFHQSSIRYTREMPWVRGYKWNLSATHGGRVPGGDVCNDYATEDHDGLGAGVFRKSNVPSKPHPQCLCFITTVTATAAQFRKAYSSGAYNSYINARKKAGLFDEYPDPMAPVTPALMQLTAPEEQ